jgi:bifunctional non-homologous end joining protein LigD
VFDLLHLDGYDVTGAPLIARKELCSPIFWASNGTDEGVLRFSQHHEGDGAQMFQQACEHHLEGLISKKRDSLYRPGRGTRLGCKTKCTNRQELRDRGIHRSGRCALRIRRPSSRRL